jgi:hypothetical protein
MIKRLNHTATSSSKNNYNQYANGFIFGLLGGTTSALLSYFLDGRNQQINNLIAENRHLIIHTKQLEADLANSKKLQAQECTQVKNDMEKLQREVNEAISKFKK